MNRTGLIIALAMAAVTGIVFGLYPELDIAIARWFYTSEAGFAATRDPWLNLIRDQSMNLVALIVAPAVLALVGKLVFPRHRMLIPGRAAVLLVTTIILGPLVLTNMLLKEEWSRPRPRDVVELGGTDRFMPWWDPRGACRSNCSFVAGEASGAAWTLAPAALAPLPWRPLAYAAAIGFAGTIGMMRVAFGGHFFSDVIFGWVFTFLVIWLMHGLLYRWRTTRTTDAAVEGGIARLGLLLRRPFGGGRPREDGGPTSP